MNGSLVRVGADQSIGGGSWNGPADSRTGNFVYVAIPEYAPTHPVMITPFSLLGAHLPSMGVTLPRHLVGKDMHLDPDFSHLTYGDMDSRAAQISAFIRPGDLLVFYAGMRDTQPPGSLIYGIIGLYVVDALVSASAVPFARWHENAHTRQVLLPGSSDIVVRAQPAVSGRLSRYIPIGDYRQKAYRVFPHLLQAWGGLNVTNGYLQRSARLPRFLNANQFYAWFKTQGGGTLLQRNN